MLASKVLMLSSADMVGFASTFSWEEGRTARSDNAHRSIETNLGLFCSLRQSQRGITFYLYQILVQLQYKADV